MRQLKWLLLFPAVVVLAAGCGSSGKSSAGSVTGETTSSSSPPTTAAHPLTLSLLSVNDMPAGWVEVCGGAQGYGEPCGQPGHELDGRLLGERAFQNRIQSPTETIGEELFSFSSVKVAELDTSNPKILLGSKLAQVLVPMSFSGVPADQVAAFTVKTGSFPENYILVRDKTTVGVFACTGDSLGAELSAIQSVT